MVLLYLVAESRRYTERYIGWPGHSPSYKIGALKIQELRERARLRLGKRFSLKNFHDQVLSDGVLPMHLLETKIDNWIATQTSK